MTESAYALVDNTGPAMTDTLAQAIARDARGRTQSRLAAESGLSPRTVRALLEGADRRFGRTTLDKLDPVLGWEPGTAWAIYAAERRSVDTVAAELAALRSDLEGMLGDPAWHRRRAVDLALRSMDAERRALIEALIAELVEFGDDELRALRNLIVHLRR